MHVLLLILLFICLWSLCPSPLIYIFFLVFIVYDPRILKQNWFLFFFIERICFSELSIQIKMKIIHGYHEQHH